MSMVRDREQAKQLIRAWWHRNGVNADHGAENVAIQAAEAAGWQSPEQVASMRQQRQQEGRNQERAELAPLLAKHNLPSYCGVADLYRHLEGNWLGAITGHKSRADDLRRERDQMSSLLTGFEPGDTYEYMSVTSTEWVVFTRAENAWESDDGRTALDIDVTRALRSVLSDPCGDVFLRLGRRHLHMPRWLFDTHIAGLARGGLTRSATMSSDRDRWQQLDQAALPPPWNAEAMAGIALEPEEAEFVAAARIGWPAAERECARLRSERDRLRQLVQQVRDLRISDSHLPEQIAELQDRIDQTSNEEEHET